MAVNNLSEFVGRIAASIQDNYLAPLHYKNVHVTNNRTLQT